MTALQGPGLIGLILFIPRIFIGSHKYNSNFSIKYARRINEWITGIIVSVVYPTWAGKKGSWESLQPE